MGRTITLDEDVAEKLEAEAARTGTSPHDIVNTTLRHSLKETNIKPAPFKVRARHMGILPGVNFDCAWKLLDELEAPGKK